MKRIISFLLIIALSFESAVFAGIGSKKAAYIGGTATEFKSAKDPITGELELSDDTALFFIYGHEQKFSIPYSKIIDLEYGQKAGRRVGASIAVALLVSPVGLFMLFSKKRKHFLTIGYKDTEEKEQVAVFELGKDIIRTTLAIIETRSGKKIEYQDNEAAKTGKSGN